MIRSPADVFISFLMLAAACAGGAEPAGKPRLAETPPMGWNSWEAFRKNLDEDAIKAQADAMVQLGLRDAGYVFIVIDGGWKTSERDAAGNLLPDPQKFPHGIKALADYVHQRGLKFGLHQPAGVKDCGHDEPGSQSNELRDAALFASWGVDFIKYDQCDFVHDPQRTPGSPDLDKIIIRKGDRVVLVSEAEAAQNHLSGLARIETRDNCSGGKCVVGIGLDNGSARFPMSESPRRGATRWKCYLSLPTSAKTATASKR